MLEEEAAALMPQVERFRAFLSVRLQTHCVTGGLACIMPDDLRAASGARMARLRIQKEEGRVNIP